MRKIEIKSNLKAIIFLIFISGASSLCLSQSAVNSYQSSVVRRAEAERLFNSKIQFQSLVEEIIRAREIPVEDVPGFKTLAFEIFQQDIKEFYENYADNKITSDNSDAWFNHLIAKYDGLYKVYLANNGNNHHSINPQSKISNQQSTIFSGPPCTNVDFEIGSLSGWTGCTGFHPNYNASGPCATPGIVTGRHTIMTGGFDPQVPGNQLTTVAPGGTYSARLGNASWGAQAEQLEQTFFVDSSNSNFTYRFAVVFENPSSHSQNEMPYFEVHMYDVDGGNALIACAEYTVKAGTGIPGFKSEFGGSILWRNWTDAYIPLGNYIGKHVKIVFITADCSQTGHYGYAYIDGSCIPLQIMASSPVICGGTSVTLTAPPGAVSYTWSNGSTGQTITITQGGTYTVTATAVSGCSNVLTKTIPSIPDIPIANFSSNNVCVGTPTAFTDQSSVSNGTITGWSWDFGVASISTDTSSQQNPQYTYSAAGTYNVKLTVTSSAGCSKNVTLQANVASFFNPAITPDTFCTTDGSATLISAMSGGTWSGTGITSTTGGIFSPSVAGIGAHAVSYCGGTGACYNCDTSNIIVDGVTLNNVSSTNITCFGANNGSINISATNASQYSINGGTSWQSAPAFSGLAPGTYNIVVRSAVNNCQLTAQAIIAEPPQLAMSFASFNVTCYNACNGYAVSIPSGGSGAYTYTWTPNPGSPAIGSGNGTASVTNLCEGSYILNVKDVNGCAKDTVFSIIQPSDFSMTATLINCNCGHPDGSADIRVIGATSAYSYQWDSSVTVFSMDSNTYVPATQFKANNLTNKTYFITITDANGCDTIYSVEIQSNPPPAVTATSNQASCNGFCDGTSVATGTGGTSPGVFTYQWNNGQTDSTATGLCAGSYIVTVTDTNNCKGFTSVIVAQPPAVVVAALDDDTICVSKEGKLGAAASGGNGAPYSYKWDNGLPPGNANQMVSPFATTCYTIYAEDKNGCKSGTDVQCIILRPPLIALGMGDQTVCEGTQVTLSAFAFGGKGAPYSYKWSLAGGGTIDTTSSITVVPPGNNTNPANYVVQVSDKCSPDVTDTVSVLFYPQPNVVINADTMKGCVPFTVKFNSSLSSPSNPASCYWDVGDSTQLYSCNAFPHTYNSVGLYSVHLIISSAEGCVDSDTAVNYIEVDPNPVAGFSMEPNPTTVQNMTIQFNNQSSGSVNFWKWSFFDNDNVTLLGDTSIPNPQFNFSSAPDNNVFIYFLTDTGNYPVKLFVKTVDGCVDSIQKIVRVDGVFYNNVPNAFTPNNDGVNDYFFPSGVGIHPNENYKLYIFNRWGDLIFESYRLNEPWDGIARAKGGTMLAPLGVYVWKLELEDVTKEKAMHKYIGHVTLLR